MKTVTGILLLLAALLTTGYGQEAGDFKLKYGLSGKDRPRHREEGSVSQKGTLSFSVNLTPRITFGVDSDTFVSKKSEDGTRITGYGNTFLNFGADLVNEDRGRPSLSLSYSLKVPTASATKGLGSGRVDHELLAGVGKSLNDRSSFEVDFGGYFAGNPGASGFTNTGELVLNFDHTLGNLESKRYKFHLEMDFSTPAKDTLSEIFGLSWLTTKLSDHVSLRAGIRAGITPNSPRIGGFATLIYNGSFRKH